MQGQLRCRHRSGVSRGCRWLKPEWIGGSAFLMINNMAATGPHHRLQGIQAFLRLLKSIIDLPQNHLSQKLPLRWIYLGSKGTPDPRKQRSHFLASYWLGTPKQPCWHFLSLYNSPRSFHPHFCLSSPYSGPDLHCSLQVLPAFLGYLPFSSPLDISSIKILVSLIPSWCLFLRGFKLKAYCPFSIGLYATFLTDLWHSLYIKNAFKRSWKWN